MSRVLILYGTTDGHTAIAHALGKSPRRLGDDVGIVDAANRHRPRGRPCRRHRGGVGARQRLPAIGEAVGNAQRRGPRHEGDLS